MPEFRRKTLKINLLVLSLKTFAELSGPLLMIPKKKKRSQLSFPYNQRASGEVVEWQSSVGGPGGQSGLNVLRQRQKLQCLQSAERPKSGRISFSRIRRWLQPQRIPPSHQGFQDFFPSRFI